jgi:hypothetical protein
MEKRKFLPLPELELRPLGLQPVVSLYTDCAIPAHFRDTFLDVISTVAYDLIRKTGIKQLFSV